MEAVDIFTIPTTCDFCRKPVMTRDDDAEVLGGEGAHPPIPRIVEVVVCPDCTGNGVPINCRAVSD